MEIEVPKNWKQDYLGNVVTFLDSQRVPIKESDRAKMQGPYPYYGASGIIDYVNDYIFDDDLILLAEDGANILLRSTPLAFRASGKIWVNNHAHVLKPNSNMDIGFLTAYLESLSYAKYNTGTAQPKLNRQTCEKIEILVPSLPEQRAIAAILGTWDRAIALTEQRLAAAEQRKKALMQQLLTGRVRFPEFVRSNDQTDTQFGKLPVDWKVSPLRRLVTSISRSENIKSSKEYKLIGVKWYVAGAHIHSVLRGEDIKTSSLSRVEPNDIIYNKMWTTKAAFAIAKPEHSGAYGTMEYPQFRTRENLLQVEYLENIFHLARFQYDAATLCRGTTGRARLNPSDFLKLEIPLPSLAEQRRIAAVLNTCDREIDLLRRKRDALQQQKKGLMQRLLMGRVRVKV